MHQFDANLVSRMKTVAKEHTLFIGESIVPNNPCLWHDVSYKNEDLNLILTYEVLEKPQTIKVWHLSIVKKDESLVETQTANEIASEILGEEAKELPLDLMPKDFRFMRQFVLKVD